MIKLNIHDECAPLDAVVVGFAKDGNKQIYHNNPKITDSVEKGVFPSEEQMDADIASFVSALEAQGIKVYRPENLPGHTQIFTRDIAFVIGDTFFVSNMKKDNRSMEIDGVKPLTDQMEKVVHFEEDQYIEGGDILIHHDTVFAGLGDRSNIEGHKALASHLKDKEVVTIYQRVTDDAYTNILHLDCAFQPVGDKYALFYEDGFDKRPDAIYDIFGEDNLIKVSQQEMYDMFPNVFSIAPDKVVVERNFKRIANELSKRGIEPIEVDYARVARMGGLLRCSTMPLSRRY
jgi:N-dimethylarginine dimethylaminohydrolase